MKNLIFQINFFLAGGSHKDVTKINALLDEVEKLILNQQANNFNQGLIGSIFNNLGSYLRDLLSANLTGYLKLVPNFLDNINSAFKDGLNGGLSNSLGAIARSLTKAIQETSAEAVDIGLLGEWNRYNFICVCVACFTCINDWIILKCLC